MRPLLNRHKPNIFCALSVFLESRFGLEGGVKSLFGLWMIPPAVSSALRPQKWSDTVRRQRLMKRLVIARRRRQRKTITA